MADLNLRQKLFNSKWLKQIRTKALKEVKRLFKEFEFTAGMLKGALAKEGGEK